MSLTYNEEELDAIEHYSGLFFSPVDIATILEKDSIEFLEDYKNNFGNVKSKYQKGYLVAQAKLRSKLILLAIDGSNTAISDVLKILTNLNKELIKYE